MILICTKKKISPMYITHSNFQKGTHFFEKQANYTISDVGKTFVAFLTLDTMKFMMK